MMSLDEDINNDLKVQKDYTIDDGETQNSPEPTDQSKCQLASDSNTNDIPVKKRIQISGAMRRKLKKLRAEGIDTHNLNIFEIKQINLKRNASSSSAPETIEHSNKRVKLDHSEAKSGYRDVSSGIKTAVIPTDFPDKVMTKEDASKIKREVVNKIDEMESGAPNFEGCRLMDGYLGFICANKESYKFLEDLVGSSGNFKVLKVKDLHTLHRIKVMATFPERSHPDKIFKRLKAQNEGLSCERWSVLGSKEDGMGYKLILNIDKPSRDYIEKKEFKLSYLLHKAFFRILEEKNNWKTENTKFKDGEDTACQFSAQ